MNETQTPDLTLSVLSDIHVTWFDELHYEGYENLERALRFHTEELSPSDAYLFTGDTVYQVEASTKSLCEKLYPEIYDRAKSLFDRYIKDTPRMMIMGNHEYPQGNPDPDITRAAQEMFKAAYGQEMRLHRVVNGYHIIGAGMISWRLPQSDDNERYVMEEVEKARKDSKGRPIFIMFHNPIPGTVTFSGKYTVGQYSDAFIEWLHGSPDLVVLSGHCHNINEDDSCIYQKGYTQVNIPIVAVGYMRFDGNGAPGFQNDYGSVFGKSQSVQIKVYGTRVVIDSYDLHERIRVNRWELDTALLASGRGYRYTEEMQASLPAPAFEEGTTLSVVSEDGRDLLAIPQRFLPYDHCIKYYTIDFIAQDGTCARTVTYPTDYFVKDKACVLRKPIPALDVGEYTVNVYACNSFAKRSKAPITTHYTVK